jgi:uncharacterized protein YegL
VTALLLALLLLWILAGLILFWWGTRTPRPGTMRLVRTCDKWLTNVNSPVNVRLWLSGNDLPGGQKVKQRHHVVYVLDQSFSMGEGPGSPLEQVVAAAASFIENVVSEDCQVGVVGFDEEARIIHPLTSSHQPLINALASARSGRGTNISQGLNLAETLYLDRSANVERLVVLLSDGAGEAESALQAARELKERSIRIVTIALGPHADEDLLRRIASSDRDFYATLAAADLERLYTNTVTSHPALRGYRALIEEFIASNHFLLTATGNPSPFESNCSSSRMKWFVPFVRTPPQDISYQVTPVRAGWRRIAASNATVEMVDINGVPVRGKSNYSPFLLVLPSGWWPGLALLFNPIFWLIWDLVRKNLRPYELVSAPVRVAMPLPETQPVRPLRDQTEAVVLKPALIVGIGYTGSLVLRALRYHLNQLQPPPSGALRFLWIDTGPSSADDLKASGPFGEPIPDEDRVLMPDNVQPVFQNLRNAASVPPHLAWLDVERTRRSLVAQDYDLSRGSQRRRVLGRVALHQHLESGPNAALCAAIDERLTFLGKHARIFVIGHMGGGSGSGMILDLLVLLQKRIQQLKQEVSSVDALLLTHRMVDNGAFESALQQNTLAFATEVSRLSIRRHLPLYVAQTPAENASPPAIKYLLDNILLLEHPLDSPSQRTQWPGPVTHSAAEVLLHLLIDKGHNAAAFLDDRLTDLRRAERASGHSLVCATGATARWLPILEIRRLLTAQTILDFLSRDLLRIERVENTFTPVSDSTTQQLVQEDIATFLNGNNLTRPRPALIGSLTALSNSSTSPAELTRIITRMQTYPGTKDTISSEIGGSAFLAEVLDNQEELFAAALEEWAFRILNGDPHADGFDHAVRRGAFSRLISSVDQLIALHAGCLQNVEVQHDAAVKRGDAHRFEFVRYLFARYRGVLSGFRRHLATWLETLLLLTNQVEGEAASARRQLQSLVDELQPYVIWSPEINDRLMARYVDPVRTRLLKQVRWNPEIVPRGSVRLTLCIHGQEDVCAPAHLDKVSAIRKSLEELIIGLEKESGLNLYRENVGEYINLQGWLQTDWRDPVNLDDNVQATLSAQPIMRRNVVLLSGHEEPGTNSTTDIVIADYPYRASVVRLLSGCALFSASALHDYERNSPGEHHVDLPFLDPVDRLAAAYEDRFIELGSSAPMLCPTMRAYFADYELLRAFALAHALGLLALRIGREQEHETLFINDIQLTPEKLNEGYPLLLEALDNFVISKRSPQGFTIDRQAIINAINLSLKSRDPETLRNIISGLSVASPRYLDSCPPIVHSDFIKLVGLFLDLELQRRETSGAH